MRSPIGWVLPLVAVLATALAVAAGKNLALAVPAAAIAVAAAAGAFVSAGRSRAEPVGSPAAPQWPSETERLRTALRGGPLAREYVLDALDRVERTGSRPDLPARSLAETQEVTHRPSREFAAYVRDRLDDLEART